MNCTDVVVSQAPLLVRLHCGTLQAASCSSGYYCPEQRPHPVLMQQQMIWIVLCRA